MKTDFKIVIRLLFAHRISKFFRLIPTLFPPWTFSKFRFFQNKMFSFGKNIDRLGGCVRPRTSKRPQKAVKNETCDLVKANEVKAKHKAVIESSPNGLIRPVDKAFTQKKVRLF